jgi:hydroxypyruvate reductase
VRLELERQPPQAGAWHLIAIGKAAGAMAQGALDVLGARVAGGCIVVPAGHLPTGFAAGSHGLAVWTAAHPVPDEHSLAAGEGVAQYVSALPARAQLLFMISGGASSLLEWLRPGVSLADLQAFNRWALGSGQPIGAVNELRGRFSRLKAGGLARLVGSRRARALLVSDVPGDDPRIIGSGLLHAPGSRRIPTRIVASSRLACEAAAGAATAQGFAARVTGRRYAGEATRLGQRFARELGQAPARVVMVRGGESTVRLPPEPGRGGRNQHLALAAAMELDRRGPAGACLLAAGTDGIDGSSHDAGAVVDAGTCLRARDGGFDPRVALERADSGSFLEASGDLLHTGATLTNVGDLVLALNPGAVR